jgi:hypothetical protein
VEGSFVVRYRFDRIELEGPEKKAATWAFAGGKTIRGTEYRYRVKDANHRQRNRWVLLVRVPDYPYGRIEVRAEQAPNDQAFVGLDHRALTFRRCTLGTYTRFRYCPLALAKPSGAAKDVVHNSQKYLLPAWLRSQLRLRQKRTVRHSKGTDLKSLVALVPRDDYEEMIRVFLATKAWVLKSGFVLD